MILIVIPISFLSARLYYILFNLDYYLKNINQILDIRNGGLAIYGGIFGAIIAIGIFCRKRNIDFLDMLDMVVPYLALGQSIGRWGNFFNIEAYGVQTQNIFRMGIIENGRYIEVHPTFLYESICTFILFLILTYVKKHRQYKGQLTYIYLLIYSIIRAIIEGMRIDSLMLGDFRISQIVSIIIFIIAFVLLFILNDKLLIFCLPIIYILLGFANSAYEMFDHIAIYEYSKENYKTSYVTFERFIEGLVTATLPVISYLIFKENINSIKLTFLLAVSTYFILFLYVGVKKQKLKNK